jgi:ABC-type Mn2+/Zn2+ transport system ATPase subunit
MLARVLVTEPDVLLLDEPTNHLDLARIGQLENWLNALPRDMPVVISSHDRARRDHEPDAVPAARTVAHVFPALYAGACRIA